jgi:nicotinamide riboside transporter PnuC
MKETLNGLFWPVMFVLGVYGWYRWREREQINETRGSLLVQSASPGWRAKLQRRVNEEHS